MNTIIGELGKSQRFIDLSNQIEKETSPISISGLTDVGMVELLSAINQYNKKPILLITYNEIQAKQILEIIENFEKRKSSGVHFSASRSKNLRIILFSVLIERSRQTGICFNQSVVIKFIIG